MRAILFILLTAFTGCAGSTDPADGAKRGEWGADAASATTTDTGATIDINASGCTGSYGEITQMIPAGAFSLDGTYTQLMGAYPGKVVHAAHFTGSALGNTLTVSISVPETQQTLGPYTLVFGVHVNRQHCLYP